LLARAYLSYAAISPPSELVKQAVAGALDDFSRAGNAAFMAFVEQRERLRQQLGQLVGADAADIALVSGTTRGLSEVAWCFPWPLGIEWSCSRASFRRT
jgi:selenocysteine lyase/cysteine desulfurase